MATRAELFFQQIMDARDRPALLHGMISARQPESEILDYKCGAKLQDDSIRRLWAKALSGFGNTEGGAVVWGIDARPTKVPDANGRERMLDVPKSADLHPDPQALAQRLRDLLRDATEHPVLGVRIEPIIDPAAAGGGFIVCLVPSGKDKPYRSATDSIYYMPVQDGFNPIPHSMLQSLFYPRTRPQIHLFAKVHFGTATTCDFNLEIRNAGSATARQLVANIESDTPMWLISGDGQMFGANMTYPSETGIKKQRLIAHQDLHPEEQRQMGSITWNRKAYPERPPNFKVAIYMADQSPANFALRLNASNIYQNNVLTFEHEDAVTE